MAMEIKCVYHGGLAQRTGGYYFCRGNVPKTVLFPEVSRVALSWSLEMGHLMFDSLSNLKKKKNITMSCPVDPLIKSKNPFSGIIIQMASSDANRTR